MTQIHPDTRFLLLGLPECCAESVRYALQVAGAKVDVACHGPYSHWFARNKPYEVIVVMLPARSVVELADLALCRQHATQSGILAVIPVRAAKQIAHVLDGGADDCVTIPFDVEELLARLCILARRIRACHPKDTILRTHDLEIDTANRRVRREGRVIDLTHREYALLELLARHCGCIVSRSLIWERLYGRTEEMTSNVIDVYIRYLRGKVDRGFELPLILTRWGQGYSLREDAERDAVSAVPEAALDKKRMIIPH